MTLKPENEMIYEGEDLTGWDPRTIEIVKRHGLEPHNIQEWRKEYNGDPRAVELRYLADLGQDIYSKIDDDVVDALEQELSVYRQAKEVFDLFLELDTSGDEMRNSMIRSSRSLCARYISDLEKKI